MRLPQHRKPHWHLCIWCHLTRIYIAVNTTQHIAWTNNTAINQYAKYMVVVGVAYIRKWVSGVVSVSFRPVELLTMGIWRHWIDFCNRRYRSLSQTPPWSYIYDVGEPAQCTWWVWWRRADEPFLFFVARPDILEFPSNLKFHVQEIPSWFIFYW